MTEIVHVVDDEETIRDSLTWLLGTVDLPSRSWDSGEAFLAELPAGGTGCVILDMRMTGMNGLAVFQEMAARGCTLPVIFLTGHADVPLAVEALKSGAFDFVEKPFNDHRLVDIIRAALDHHRAIGRNAANRADATARLASLTLRERQVMDRMILGQLNKQIAGDLDLAIRTVEVHRAHVLQKFGVRSLAELVGIVARLDKDG